MTAPAAGPPNAPAVPRAGVRRLRRGLLAALLSVPLLAGLAPVAHSKDLCGSPTPIPAGITPPVDLEDAITFEFAQNTYTTYASRAGTASTVSIEVTRTGTRAASVNYETGDGTLTAGHGYTHAAGTLHFAAGEVSKSFPVEVSGGRRGPGAFHVFLSNATAGGAVCSGSARPWGSAVWVYPEPSVAACDNDGGTPLIEFRRTRIDTAEGETAKIHVRKIGCGAASVDYATADGTRSFRRAKASVHYTAASGTLSFARWETEKTITVEIPDDGKVDVDRDRDLEFTIGLSNPNGAALGTQRVARVTIKRPRFEFTSANYYVREDRGPVVITVRKIGPGPGGVEYLTIAEGHPFAEPPGDRPIVEDTLIFAADETEKTFTVPIVDDMVPEDDEQFGVALRTPPHRGELGKNRAFVTIRNWPPARVVRFKDQEVALAPEFEVQENAGKAILTVEVEIPEDAASQTVTVDYRTVVDTNPGPGTAVPPGDYTAVLGTLTFAPSETEMTISIPIMDDDTEEQRESILVYLENPSGAIFDPEFLRLRNPPLLPAIVYLIDDDGAPPSPQRVLTPTELTISASPATSVTEGGDVTFTVTSDPAPQLDLTVNVGHNEEMGAGLDYVGQGETTTVTVPAGQTTASWTVTAMSDDVERADGEVSGRIMPREGWYTLGYPSEVTLALVDDDGAQGGPPQGAQDGTVVHGTPAVPAELVAQVRSHASESQHGTAHVKRWRRVLVAFGVESYPGLTATTAAEARANAEKYSSPLWPRIAKVLAKLEALPEVTVTAGDAVTEGGDAVFTVTATPPAAAPLAVTVTVAADGAFGVTAGSRTVSIGTSGSATLTVPTTDDEADEPDGSVTATVKDGSGYTVGSAASGTVAVQDDDLPPPVISIAAKAASVSEGGDAAFTLTADRASDADLVVKLSVSEAAVSDHVAAAHEGAATATIAKGKTKAEFTVATVDDSLDEPDGTVTVTVGAGNGYTVTTSPGDAAGVAVLDNDASALPVLSVGDATVREGAEWLMTFTVRLSAAADAVEVRADTRAVSAEPKEDYWPLRAHRVRFGAGETEKRVQVLVYDDSHDEEAETFELVLSDARGAVIGDGVAVGTIVNDDPMPAAWLARFGRTVAEQALDGIAGRMAAPRAPGMQGRLAGQALGFDAAASGQPVAGRTPGGASAPAGPGSWSGAGPRRAVDEFGDDRFGNGAGFGAPAPQSRSMTAREALLGSSFLLTGQKDGAGGSLGFWGRASQGYFDSAERGDGTDITLDGEVTTGMLGADYARGKWLVGLALTRSSADGGYAAEGDHVEGGELGCPPVGGEAQELCRGAVRDGDGGVEASLTAAIPWAALRASERLKLWGAAGYGSGKVTLKTMEENYKADTSWSMAAAGMRNDLLTPPADGGGGPALALTTDALWTRTSSDRTRDLAASDSDATRLRLGLEGSWRMALADGGSLAPRVEIGARHDGGDAETGFGAEFGGGIAWVHPALGLSLDVSGRTLVAHENDDLKDRGFSAQLGFDPHPATRRGPSFSLRQDLGGRAQGGLDALFAPDPLEDRTGSEAAPRLAMEAAYGFAAFGGRFTGSPHVGMGLSTGAQDYSVGWRLTPEAVTATDLSFGLKAMRRESDTQAPDHTIGFEVLARW